MGYLAKAGVLNQTNLRKAIAYGTVAASFNVEDFGMNKTARLSMNDLNKRLAEFKKFILF